MQRRLPLLANFDLTLLRIPSVHFELELQLAQLQMDPPVLLAQIFLAIMVLQLSVELQEALLVLVSLLPQECRLVLVWLKQEQS